MNPTLRPSLSADFSRSQVPFTFRQAPQVHDNRKSNIRRSPAQIGSAGFIITQVGLGMYHRNEDKLRT